MTESDHPKFGFPTEAPFNYLDYVEFRIPDPARRAYYEEVFAQLSHTFEFRQALRQARDMGPRRAQEIKDLKEQIKKDSSGLMPELVAIVSGLPDRDYSKLVIEESEKILNGNRYEAGKHTVFLTGKELWVLYSLGEDGRCRKETLQGVIYHEVEHAGDPTTLREGIAFKLHAFHDALKNLLDSNPAVAEEYARHGKIDGFSYADLREAVVLSRPVVDSPFIPNVRTIINNARKAINDQEEVPVMIKTDESMGKYFNIPPFMKPSQNCTREQTAEYDREHGNDRDPGPDGRLNRILGHLDELLPTAQGKYKVKDLPERDISGPVSPPGAVPLQRK